MLSVNVRILRLRNRFSRGIAANQFALVSVLISCVSSIITSSTFVSLQAGVIEFSDECWSRVSVEARQCIESMLTVDPARRATADQILVHPWFTSGKSCEGGELTAAVVKLKKWRARKRMKGGAKAVLALRAFQSHAQSSATKSFHGTSS